MPCSTYYGFCGNAGTQRSNSDGDVRAAVCSKWLHPVRMSEHPAFKGWVIYGRPHSLSKTSAEGQPCLAQNMPFLGPQHLHRQAGLLHSCT